MLASHCTSSVKSSLNVALALVALALAAPGCALAGDDNADEPVESAASSIVGGQATSGFVSVGALTRFGSPFCTGTVIAPRLVATAAHCLDGVRASTVRFALGPNGFAPQATLSVVEVIPHPQYDARRISNDIGVVVLGQDAPVPAVPVNTSMDAGWVGRQLVFVGYGATSGSGRGGGTKRAVAIPIAQVGATQFAYTDRARNTCFGDSGGPAFAVGEDNALTLVGVTSYGDSACARFGVDTRVDAYRAFLDARR